jgi:hypothetical protein
MATRSWARFFGEVRSCGREWCGCGIRSVLLRLSRTRCDQRLRRVRCAVPYSYFVTGFDEVHGHTRLHPTKPKNRNLTHATPKLTRELRGLLVRLQDVSGFTIRRRPCRNAHRWPDSERRPPTGQAGSCGPRRGVPPPVRAQRHSPAGGACCRP